MTEHTPGPWIIEEERTILGSRRSPDDFDPYYICDVQDTVEGLEGDDPVANANARLIAAAPDLLEACEEFARWEVNESQLGAEQMAAKILAAIAKATKSPVKP